MISVDHYESPREKNGAISRMNCGAENLVSAYGVIPPGEMCSVEIGGDLVISGYVDSVSVSYDANSHEIKVSGRDKTGDLVDCSAPSTSFAGQTFEQIARALCAPFGIAITDKTTSGKKPRVISSIGKQTCQNGESVYKTLEKLARSEGVLLVSDGNGGLVITRAALDGDCKTVLEFGTNILRASFDRSHANLFSNIIVKGQQSAAGAEQFNSLFACAKGEVRRAPAVQSTSSQIARYRPLIIVAESQGDASRCQRRAEWEASNREAKARKVAVTVQGWREPATGELWKINKRVKVKCPWMRLDEWWLIASVGYRLDESGSVADLSLVSDKSFEQLPEIPDPKGGASSGNRFNIVGKKK